MQLAGPYTFQLKFDATRIVAIADSNGGTTLSGVAAKPVPKLYVISEGQKPLYVGVTKQSIRNRLRGGFDAKGSHGYHGYAWRHHLQEATLNIWIPSGASWTSADLETVEGEVVFLIRKELNEWPKWQTEIHFHASGAEHREAAQNIFAHYLPVTKPERQVGMRRDEALRTIRAHWSELQEKGIATLSLLGSLARDEAGPEDEVYILVELNKPLGFAFFGIQEDLADLLGRPVILLTPDSFRAEERERWLRDAVRAA